MNWLLLFSIILDMEVELKRKSNRFANRNVSSKAGQKNKFHGFFFGINMEIMNSVAHNLGLQLLPTTYSLAGQEDYKLLQLMSAKNYTPKIALDVFVYHFKALPRGGEATSDVATAMLTGGKSLNEKYIRRQNISLEAIKALSEREMSRKNDHHTDELRDKTPGFSRRRLRHHEDRQSYFNNANANATIPTADELMMIKPLPQKYTQIRYNGGYNYPFASMRTAQSLLSNNAINFPTLYEKYKSLYTDIELRTYPTCSDAYVAYPKNATDEVCASYVESARIVIAIAVSGNLAFRR